MAKITAYFLLAVVGLYLVLGDDGPDDMCIKCLCHARTGCYFLRNCASYSISYDYWQTAGSPSIDSSTGRTAYEKCKKNEDCIRATIRGYIRTHDLQDCNNDGVVDCKDYAMIHYEGHSCNRLDYLPQTMGYIPRLDKCLGVEMPKMGKPVPKHGWEVVPAQ